MPSFNSGLSVLGICLSVAIASSSVIVAETIRDIKLNTAITVKGYAEERVKSDSANWTSRVSVSAKTRAAAYQKLKQDVPKVIEYLVSQGLQRNEISTSSISSDKIYKTNAKGYNTNQVDRYVLKQSVYVSTSNVYLVNRLARDVTTLIDKGISINSFNPSYYYSKVNSLKIDLLGEATKNASKRAEQLAENSGGKVGRLLSARQGVFQITPVNSTDVSDYGTYNTQTIDKAVKAVVTIKYSVN